MASQRHSKQDLPEIVTAPQSAPHTRVTSNRQYYQNHDMEKISPPVSPPNSPPAPPYRRFPQDSSAVSQVSYPNSVRPISPPIPDYTSQDGYPTLTSQATGFSHYSEHLSPDPQVVQSPVSDKEAYHEVIPDIANPHSPFASAPEPILPLARRRESRKEKSLWQKSCCCGLLPVKWCCPIAVLVVLIAAGIALGVVFGRKHNDNSQPVIIGNVNSSIGGTLSPSYYSKSGAFNGSGIAVASVNFNEDPSIYMFYQNYNGAIKQLLLRSDGQNILYNDIPAQALNGTPLSTVAYINANHIATWHLFYIDTNYFVRQKVFTNASRLTSVWLDGPLNNLNIPASKANMIGMQACYWGNFYGSNSANYDNGFNYSVASTTPKTGMHLWYAKNATTFGQYSFTEGATKWTYDQDWPNMNAQAGVGCQSWLSGPVQYVTMADLTNTIRFFWQDYNVNQTNTTTHPINTWVEAPINISNVHPTTSMGYTNYFVYQAADYSIQGYNISWAAENATILPARVGNDMGGYDGWKIPQPYGVPGTHLSITALKTPSNGVSLNVFYQVNGSDIKMLTRDNTAGAWSAIDLPVYL